MSYYQLVLTDKRVSFWDRQYEIERRNLLQE